MKYYHSYEYPIGELKIAEKDGCVVYVTLAGGAGKDVPEDYERRETKVIKQAAAQLTEYFAGKRKVFDLPLEFRGTDFQKSVWEALLEIPWGETKTYGEIAKRIGNPKAQRAVGMANNRNPIAVICPCHRVIGQDGSLTGYAGGLGRKEYLLKLEGAM